MILGIICFLFIIMIGILFFLTKNMYEEEMKYINKKEYKLKDLIPTSLYLNDKLLKKRLRENSNVRDSILLIYGKKDYNFRFRMHEAEKISIGIITLIGVLFITMVLSIQGDSRKINNNTINKPPLGKGNATYDLQAEIEIEGEEQVKTIKVIIPEKNPNKEQAKKILQEAANTLPHLILGKNVNLKIVNKRLNLINMYPESNIKINWDVNSSYVERNGELNYSNIKEGGNETNIIAKLTYAGESIEKAIQIKVYPKELSKEEQLELIEQLLIKQLSKDKLMDKSDYVKLPTKLEGHDVKIKWFLESDDNITFKFLIVGLIIARILMILKDYEIKRKVQERSKQIRQCFPDFIIKLTLLLNAGMTLNRAWAKIGNDYYDYLNTQEGKKQFLYEEMLETLQNINNGISEIKAYEDFGKRCKIPEMMRFTSVIIQNIRKGNDTLVIALQAQASEAWDVRKNIAKKAGEKASSKLLIPMGIMLIIIILIVMMPAFMSLGI